MRNTDRPPFPPVRRLGPADLRQCLALAVDRGWAPERARWSLLLEVAEPFGVDAPDGRGLAGAVVLTRYGTDSGPGLASVGMMLVAARYARRGLGRAVMEHALAAAGPGTAVTLFATDMGRPLYEKLGFRPVRRSVAFTGWFRPPATADNSIKREARTEPAGASRVRDATEADLPGILAADRAAFGADRGDVIRRLPRIGEGMAVLESEQGITGYAAAWRTHPASTLIGPVIAPDAAGASLLVETLAARATTPVRVDIDPDRPELPGWAHRHGLEPVSRTTAMTYGPPRPAPAPGRLFAPISLALS